MAKRSYQRKTAKEQNEQVQQLLNQLHEGVKNFSYDPEKFKAILQMQSLMPSYSFRNMLLIQSQLDRASYVASFKHWKTLGRNVIKGQTALRILAPRFKKEEDEVTGEEDSKLIGYLGVPVFDVSQTEGDPLPIDKVKLKLDGESDEAVRIFEWTKLLAEEDDCRFNIAFANGANGYYQPSTHQIVIDPSLSINHRAKTAVHELVHSRVHRYSSANTTKVEKESVAEGVAFIICSYFGLDTSDYSFEYVRGWSGDEGVTLMKYGGIIQKTANKLIGDYERISTSLPQSISTEPTKEGQLRGVKIADASPYRIPLESRQADLHYYDIRHHDENGMRPATIENRVFANHMGTIATTEPLHFGPDGLALTEAEEFIILQAI